MNKLLKQNAIMIYYITNLIENLEDSIKKIPKRDYAMKEYLRSLKKYLEICLKEVSK